jgi:TonB-linked SusC/RagA family outer membrane protein
MKQQTLTNWLWLPLLLAAFGLQAQQVRVTGTVTSQEDGETLIGVNILIKGTSSGTITDFEGNYELNVPSPDVTLVFSYTGFESQEIALAGRTRLDVVMGLSRQVLDEIVVVGYGTQRKSDLTGAISTVKAEEIQRIPSANLEQALQGRVSGVQVTPVSGEPGAGAIIRIRGTGTLNDASPLYVVDGMLLDDISFLNLNDVESVEVLKDASATAIYGSRGANGVIIITTKKGERRAAVFTASAYYGVQNVLKQIDLVNGAQFAQLANEVAVNEGRSPLFPDPESFGEGTDWQSVIFQPAPIQNYQFSANGGSDNMIYNLSLNYFGQEGIVRGSEFQRLTLRLNNEYTLSNRFSFGHNLAMVYTQREVAANVVPTAYRAEPIIPVRDSLGNFGDATVRVPVSNPEAQIFYNNNSNFGYRTVGNAYLDVRLPANLVFRSNLGMDLESTQGKNFVPQFEVSPTSLQRSDVSRLNVNQGRTFSWLWENTLSFNKEWTNHRLNLLGGITAQEFNFENLGGGRINFPGETPEFFYLNAGEILGQTNFNTGFAWSMLSYLFRANYTLMDRYLFTASYRIDGSSRFGANNRYGHFPSLAAGWNLSNEGFMENIDFISRLKLRASWGQIGNDKIGAYAGRPTVTTGLNAVLGRDPQLLNGASIVSLANPFIRWESTTQSNFGMEIGLLDNRLVAEVDYYNRVTDDILVPVPIPDYIGADAFPIVNAAKVRNSGLDFNLGWRERRGKVSYNFNLVASTVNNEVLGLGEGQEAIFGGGIGIGGLLGTRTVVGLPIGSFFGYVVDGVFQNQAEIDAAPTWGRERPGDLRFRDINDDGVITTDDRTFIGSPIPDFIYGFSGGFDVAGFDFFIDFNGQRGNKIINAKKMARFGTYNFESSFLSRWTGEGTSNTEPRITNGGHNYEMSERFIEDGSFMRLRTLQIGYTLPSSLLGQLRLSKLRVYANGTNLITWDNYSGYTPEIASGSVIDVGIDRGVFPIAKVFTFGLDIGF